MDSSFDHWQNEFTMFSRSQTTHHLDSSRNIDAIPNFTPTKTFPNYQTSSCKRTPSSDFYSIQDSQCRNGALFSFTPCAGSYSSSDYDNYGDNFDKGTEEISYTQSMTTGQLIHKVGLSFEADLFDNSTFNSTYGAQGGQHDYARDSIISTERFIHSKPGRNDISDTCGTLDGLVSTYSSDINNRTELDRNGVNDINTKCIRNSIQNNCKKICSQREIRCSRNSNVNKSAELNRLNHDETIRNSSTEIMENSLNRNVTRNSSINSSTEIMENSLNRNVTRNSSINSSTEIMENSLNRNVTRNSSINSGMEIMENSLNRNVTRNSSINSSMEIMENSLNRNVTRNSSINSGMEIMENSLNHTETTRNNISNFRNSPTVSLSKSNPTLLPPCRICGAKASGFHYGVNSCEACKGFFRRALKRPMTFYCTKNRKCDVNGNRRSTCRFCRYKRCLRLGMSVESIKTGRYSHRKRTRDTIEVKRLQNSPNALEDEFEMDFVIESLISADDSLITSTTNVPKDVIFLKQLEYHKAYCLHKKCSNCRGFSLNNLADTSPNLDHDSTRCNCKDGGNPDFCELTKLSTPSLSSSEISTDSGFVDELDSIINGNKSEASRHEINEDLQDSIPVFGDEPLEATNEISHNNYVERYDTPAVKNNQQRCIHLSPLNEIVSMDTFEVCDSKHEYNGHVELIRCKESDVQPHHDSENTGHCGSNEYPSEKINQQLSNYNISRPKPGYIPSSGEILEDSANQISEHSINTRKDVLSRKIRHESKKDSCSVVNDKSCAHRSTYASLYDSSSKSENINCRRSRDTSAKDTSIHSQNTLNSTENSFKHNYVSENICKNSSNGTTEGTVDTVKTGYRISKGHTAEVNSMSTLKPDTELRKEGCMGEFNDSLLMRRQSQEEAIQRVKQWIRGYIDFANTIPGFSSLGSQDQKALLKHAWDEVWILGSCRGYNSDFGVAMMPCGKCFHGDEMESVWGKSYSRISFSTADIINRHNLTPGLTSLLKAVCIVTPDRCQLSNPKRVADIHWMMVSCVLRHIQMTYPADHLVFPRLVSILVSLREISESARRDLDSGCLGSGSGCSGLEELVTFF